MPRQNRVTPFGEIVAVPERGTLMGNRGILHDAAAEHDPNARVRRRWASPAWISCLLEFRGRRDPVMAPHQYTRLFFLDEPTALAAGHRPCAYCRRADYLAFRAAWASANASLGLGPTPYATEIDRVLHAERLGPGGTKRTYLALVSDLPDGTFVTPNHLPRSRERGSGGTKSGFDTGRPEGRGRGDEGAPCTSRPVLGEKALKGRSPGSEGEGRQPYLLWRGAFWCWTPAGYAERLPLPDGEVAVLTPPSTVGALRAGFMPFPPVIPGAGPASPSPSPRAGPD